jgi:hypothetical protein
LLGVETTPKLFVPTTLEYKKQIVEPLRILAVSI